MQITPPFGYREIVPLQKTQGVKLPAPGKVPEFCASTNAMPISYSEFRVAGHDYPLVFASGDSGQTFAAVAVVGLANGENLFARDGSWVSDMYVPAYVRRYPFCMARVTLEKKEQTNRLICVEKDYIAEKGEMLFDAKGEPLEKWQNIEKLLREYEADLERTREMCAVHATGYRIERRSREPFGDVSRQGREARAPERGPAQEPFQEGHHGAHLRSPALAGQLRPADRPAEQAESARPCPRPEGRGRQEGLILRLSGSSRPLAHVRVPELRALLAVA
jgi:hypothetical protein